MKRALLLLAAALLAPGCASFGVWSSPAAQAVSCAITSTVLTALEDLLVIPGVLLGPITQAYADACAKAAAKGMSQHDAEEYGLAHARGAALKMARDYQLAHVGEKSQ